MPRTTLSNRAQQRGKNLAKKLSVARKKMGLTQAQLADHARISLDTLRSIENARVKVPGIFVIYDLSKVLKANLTDWLREER